MAANGRGLPGGVFCQIVHKRTLAWLWPTQSSPSEWAFGHTALLLGKA